LIFGGTVYHPSIVLLFMKRRKWDNEINPGGRV
jgi:hypothetical protein